MQNFNSTSQSVIKELKNYISKVKSALKSQDFFDYIAKKSKEVLDEVTAQSLNSDDEQQYSHVYRLNHEVKVDFNEIVLSNQVIIPSGSLNPAIANNYPDGFDLSKAIEYGTGIIGAESGASTIATDRGWQYDVNGHGEKGWFYKDENGEIWWTRGMTGKLIYYKSKQIIEEKINDWIVEYIQNI